MARGHAVPDVRDQRHARRVRQPVEVDAVAGHGVERVGRPDRDQHALPRQVRGERRGVGQRDQLGAARRGEHLDLPLRVEPGGPGLLAGPARAPALLLVPQPLGGVRAAPAGGHAADDPAVRGGGDPRRDAALRAAGDRDALRPASRQLARRGRAAQEHARQPAVADRARVAVAEEDAERLGHQRALVVDAVALAREPALDRQRGEAVARRGFGQLGGVDDDRAAGAGGLAIGREEPRRAVRPGLARPGEAREADLARDEPGAPLRLPDLELERGNVPDLRGGQQLGGPRRVRGGAGIRRLDLPAVGAGGGQDERGGENRAARTPERSNPRRHRTRPSAGRMVHPSRGLAGC